jgi:caa(3)-type oxidase subunit IV
MSEPTATAEKHPAHGHEAHDDHGHHGSVYAHAKPYIRVGIALFVFTCITVWLSYFDFAEWRYLPQMFAVIGVSGMGINIVIGLMVASLKVCLVGWYFMHLKQEGSGIWRPLFFTFFFCLGLFLLCLLAFSDPIPTTSHPLH